MTFRVLIRRALPRCSCGILAGAVLLALASWAPPCAAGPYIWDQDEDRIDDRIEQVHLLGYSASFEQADTLARQRFEVVRVGGDLLYGVYVIYDHVPTTTDLAQLTFAGMPVRHRIESLPAVRSVATWAQLAVVSTYPGIERIEAVPLLYAQLHDGAAAIGARDASERVFPVWPGGDPNAGQGVIVAFLDTGINDAAAGGWPGHESLAGRCVGGAVFTHGDSVFDTPRDGSVNPGDSGGGAHGTHVAGIAVGGGGSSAFAIGIAPAARFVDVQVLNEAGIGTGVCEALDWCIANRARDWGAGDPALTGIDVINLSLSSPDASDGNDLAARLAAHAAQLGIMVVASMGNDGRSGMAPSPAAGDGVIAVGAWDVQRSGPAGDDLYPALNNYGPRAGDGDADALDEQKPDLLAPGVAVLSADGGLATDGAQYRRASGTSAAAAFVSGAAAALRSAAPTLAPAELRERLVATARRNLGTLPAGVTGADPRWYSPRGYGVLDLYAAWIEVTRPERTQVRRLSIDAAFDLVSADLWTQRERGAEFLVFERAPDVAGAPGAFAAIDSVPAAGDSSLAGPPNLSSYVRSWLVAPAERGASFWYRAAYTEDGVRWNEPARRVTIPAGPSAATLELTIVHNAYDHDLDAMVTANGAAGSVSFPLPGSSAAVATEWLTGAATIGNVALTFHVEIPAGTADAFLPPSPATPWTLSVTEAGFLNRSGRVTAFRVIRHTGSGDEIVEGGPLPTITAEGQTSYAQAPIGVASVDPAGDGVSTRFGPNPVRAGAAVSFASGTRLHGDLEIFDTSGRRLARVPFAPSGAGRFEARWSAVQPSGHPLPAGIYFARINGARPMRIVVLSD